MAGLVFLEDGTVYCGEAFGAHATASGELVFNTSMIGYQEVLSDPVCSGQVINMTYPIIGSCGISTEGNESDHIHARGLIARYISDSSYHYSSIDTIDSWLKKNNVPGVSGVDTRSITKKIRSIGTCKCVISTEGISPGEAAALCGRTELRSDCMKTAGTSKTVHIEGKGSRVALFDFGASKSFINILMQKDCDIYLFPYTSKAEEILSVRPDGIILSGGPGDPKAATEAVAEVSRLLNGYIPVFGVGLGHQIMALSSGGKTYKLKFGHRGGNHGVFDKISGCSYIVSQNHGYAVNAESVISKGMEITHVNLNDGTVEGMRHIKLPFLSVQFYPGNSPESHGSSYPVNRFIDLMKGGKGNA